MADHIEDSDEQLKYIEASMLLTEFENMVAVPEVPPEDLAGLCQISRRVRVEWTMAAEMNGIKWTPEVIERLHNVLHRAIELSTGTEYEKNIAQRAKALCKIARRFGSNEIDG